MTDSEQQTTEVLGVQVPVPAALEPPSSVGQQHATVSASNGVPKHETAPASASQTPPSTPEADELPEDRANRLLAEYFVAQEAPRPDGRLHRKIGTPLSAVFGGWVSAMTFVEILKNAGWKRDTCRKALNACVSRRQKPDHNNAICMLALLSSYTLTVEQIQKVMMHRQGGGFFLPINELRRRVTLVMGDEPTPKSIGELIRSEPDVVAGTDEWFFRHLSTLRTAYGPTEGTTVSPPATRVMTMDANDDPLAPYPSLPTTSRTYEFYVRTELDVDSKRWKAMTERAQARVVGGRQELQSAHYRMAADDLGTTWYERLREDADALFLRNLREYPAMSEDPRGVRAVLEYISECLQHGGSALMDLQDLEMSVAGMAHSGTSQTRPLPPSWKDGGKDEMPKILRDRRPFYGVPEQQKPAFDCVRRWPELLAFDFHAISMIRFGFQKRYGVDRAIIGWYLSAHAREDGWYPLLPLFLHPTVLDQVIRQQRDLAYRYLAGTKLKPELADPARWWPNLLLPLTVFEERLNEARTRLKQGAAPLLVLTSLREPY